MSEPEQTRTREPEQAGIGAGTTEALHTDRTISIGLPQRTDLEQAAARGIDINDPRIGLKVASERLSIVRYVFLVAIEDGIATADQRASLEYADAALIGWPEMDADDIVDLEADEMTTVSELLDSMERYITQFRRQESDGDVDGMTDSLVHTTECTMSIRRLYQPETQLPTYDEIRHVVQDEWDRDMDQIDPPIHDATVETIEEETEQADEQRQKTGNDKPQTQGRVGRALSDARKERA
ncbi:hypothetical protein [Bifidobacterium bohemicum]|uniref:Phosphoribosylglycinamide synthetase n=1 Tax=Bifidobacterium bohemicum DSM 22767 TaxID=1437606 RepID=A0A086ZJE8_9BIFI|nr:hypothetical protein [Bifidobacterium bohemicum]KFI46648.1 hypothetical protein BBOH_0120 [Bifidobacterium bohemicum DSM 22767]